jgi:trehalose 6-phosphate synthase
MVNPYLPEDCAHGIAEALSMPRGERIERHRAMLAKVTSQTAQKWAADFLRDLSASDP